ncbi:uncharacterized protein JN550_005515 [Neoarthrinium moseri]|uniref:uncharacterized protein n=1 Tax=Neoarthrinium moseri TaxID=1658444 RepID=UPI001FDBB58E|nr:uncharacterized protein JN550_005515 [Neoarthrinium moseri]KAI1869925.1 hypothetical protein JN550_005515 [Neoarthrinium moseri]
MMSWELDVGFRHALQGTGWTGAQNTEGPAPTREPRGVAPCPLELPGWPGMRGLARMHALTPWRSGTHLGIKIVEACHVIGLRLWCAFEIGQTRPKIWRNQLPVCGEVMAGAAADTADPPPAEMKMLAGSTLKLTAGTARGTSLRPATHWKAASAADRAKVDCCSARPKAAWQVISKVVPIATYERAVASAVLVAYKPGQREACRHALFPHSSQQMSGLQPLDARPHQRTALSPVPETYYPARSYSRN